MASFAPAPVMSSSTPLDDSTLTSQHDVVAALNTTIQQYFDIDRTVEQIRALKVHHIALQLPDSLLQYATRIERALKDTLRAASQPAEAVGSDYHLYIMADTSYSPCCVDEIAALHVKEVQCIIHYGSVACLSPTRRLPVIYVFGAAPYNVKAAATCLLQHMQSCGKPIVTFTELDYSWSISELQQQLASQSLLLSDANVDAPHIILAAVTAGTQDATAHSDQTQQHDKQSTLSLQRHSITGYSFALPKQRSLSDYSIVYIGSANSPVATNIALNYNQCEFNILNPTSSTPSIQPARSVSRQLARRYYLVNKAANAQIIGIVVGTLGIAQYMAALKHIRQLISSAGKNYYTMAVGKLNEPKLANYSEVDIFVLVSCPLAAATLDTYGHSKDVITPYELELALSPSHSWTGAYQTDWHSILTADDTQQKRLTDDKQDGAEETKAVERDQNSTSDDDDDEDLYGMRYDSLNRKMVPMASHQHHTAAAAVDSVDTLTHAAKAADQQLITRSMGELTVANGSSSAAVPSRTAADVMAERTFKGLQRRRGKDAPAVLKDGLSGIASVYEKDAALHSSSADHAAE